MTEINSSIQSIIPYFLPQGVLLPGQKGVEFTAFAFVPNAMFVAIEPRTGAPDGVGLSLDGLGHLTLPLASKGSVSSAADLQGRPVSWSAKEVDLGDSVSHVALHVAVEGGPVVSTSIIRLVDTPAAPTKDSGLQRLSALEEAVGLLGTGGLEAIELLKKMKDGGF